MTSFDYIVLVVVGVSIVMSMMRGAVRELLALVGWVIAFYVARTYSPQLIPLLPEAIPSESLKVLAAFIILMLAVLLIVSLLSIALSSFIKKIGLNWLNRFVGALFGLVRGVFIVCVLVMLAGLTSLPKDTRWTNAMFSSPLEVLVTQVLPYLPNIVSEHVSFS